ncbi:MAG: bifunctional riboflavin kinase/FAD synthetase [Candidatus Omnitrophica bacterium]|nr:bifunctional riboflavin kinase/FAD synthetase [Candidatus Omnitrophota bacterium]
MIFASSLDGFPSNKFPRTVLTLGAFDGVHRGHRAVLRRVAREARKRRAKSVVLTFQEHPQKVLRPERGTSLLTSFEHKLSLLAAEDLDLCLGLHFNRRFSRLSPEEFVKRVLCDRMRVVEVILGHDARFGKGRAGGTETMKGLAKKFGFRFQCVPPMKVGAAAVSSTRIRALVSEGRLKEAGRQLGRPYSILASVIKGAGRGRKLGFPTANLDPHSEILPPEGVYAARVRLIPPSQFNWKRGVGLGRVQPLRGRGWLPAVLNLGRRPTFEKKGRPVAEVHLIGFRGDLYGHQAEIEFVRKIRDERTFPDAFALGAQIRRDVAKAREFLRDKSGQLSYT